MLHSLTRLAFALFVISLVSLLRTIPAWSQAILIEPKRVLLDDRHRMRAVNLYNNSDDTLSYSLGWSHLRMDTSGQYANIDTVLPSDHLADTLVRFFPPEVTLSPHSSQVVRLRYLKPPGAQLDEARSHLTFSQVDRGEPLEWKLRDSNSVGARVRARPLFGLSIPVIVRSDTSVATVRLDRLSISPMDSNRHATVGLAIERAGNNSCYGALLITYVSPSGKEEEIGQLNNISVFPPLPYRSCRIYVTIPHGVDLHVGRIEVAYRTAPDDDTPFRVISTAKLVLTD